MTAPSPDLDSVIFGWSDAYRIGYTRDQWAAWRRDTHRRLTAVTLAGLEHAITADYQHHPVPRDYDPPPATDDLDHPDRDTGYDLAIADADDEPGVDEETLNAVLALRAAFPGWVITYEPQMHAWIARTPAKTICENSSALLCAALAMSERSRLTGQPGSRLRWPGRES